MSNSETNLLKFELGISNDLHRFSFGFPLLSIVFHYFSKLFHIYVTLTFNRERK
jgi:hypothetical protein